MVDNKLIAPRSSVSIFFTYRFEWIFINNSCDELHFNWLFLLAIACSSSPLTVTKSWKNLKQFGIAYMQPWPNQRVVKWIMHSSMLLFVHFWRAFLTCIKVLFESLNLISKLEALSHAKWKKVEQNNKIYWNFCRKKWLPQQLRKLSHSKTDKLPVDKSALKKGSDKKSKVIFSDDFLRKFRKSIFLSLGQAKRRTRVTSANRRRSIAPWTVLNLHQLNSPTSRGSWRCARVPWATATYETDSRRFTNCRRR